MQRLIRRSVPGEFGNTRRNGAILVLVAAVLIMTMIFAAFTVDIGFIALSKAEMQKTADGCAVSSIIELRDGLGPAAEVTQSQAEAAARQAVVDVAAANRGGGLTGITADPSGDVRLGNVVWDSGTNSWVKTWGVQPYNMIEVTIRRSNSASGPNDGSLPLFFGPIINKNTATVSGKAIAAVLPASGFRLMPGQPGNVEVLPIALDEGTWNDLMNGTGTDSYTWNSSTETVSSGGDGQLEVNLYPDPNSNLPPGNRGTVDFGSNNNSTADLSRQILNGLNVSDMSYFGGEINFDNGPLQINGDTGISAGIKDELEAIKGQPRAIPIFTQVSGNGNNAYYTVVRFVGVRIMAVKLTGKNKHVIIQPATVSSRRAVPGSGSISTGSVMTAPMLIE